MRKIKIFFIFSPEIKNSFIIELYSFTIGIKVVRNVISNNIDINNQPSRMHRSPSRSHQTFVDSKFQILDKSDRRRNFRFDLKVFCSSKQKLSEMIF